MVSFFPKQDEGINLITLIKSAFMKKTLLFSAAMLAASAAIAQDGVIKEQPEGTLRTFHGYSLATEVSWGFASEGPHDGLARQVVFADNGDVYFKNPITKANIDCWIKGTLKDGVITVELPQLVDVVETEEGVEEWYVQRFVGTPFVDDEGDEDIEWNVDPEKTSITYTFRNDSIIQDQKLEKLALMYDGKHMYYGDRDVVYTAVDEHASVMPEGIEPERWSFKYNEVYANQVKIAFDGNDMYIQGFWPEFPQAVMKGTIDGDKATILSQQYLGFLTSGDKGYYTYLMNSSVESGWSFTYTTIAEPMVFNFDRETNTMTAAGDKTALIVHSGKTPGVPDYRVRLSLRDPYFSKIGTIGKPVTPTITWINRDYEYAWGYVECTIPAEDVDGNCFDINQMTYCMWLDDEKNVFDPELVFADQYKYKDLEAPTTDLPYNFDNGSGISTRGSIGQKYLQFFELGFDELGIQSTYYDDLTERVLKSDIIYINPETKETRIQDVETGVEAVNAPEAEIAEIAFFDLDGRRLQAPVKGMYIKVITYADGSSKTFKKIGR